MVQPGQVEAAGQRPEPDWMPAAMEQFRVRGYLTLSVRIGYETVLIVSGSAGEAAIIDLSTDPTTVWTDAWAGMRQVLPRVPVVAVVPNEADADLALDEQAPVTRVNRPVATDALVKAVEQLLRPTVV